MKTPEIVIDTNILISGLLSRKGASFRLLYLIGKKKFQVNLSVSLLLEYEDASVRMLRKTALKKSDLDDILDYICREARHHEVFFLWRPQLKDPKDDMVLELAVTSRSEYIVTYNKRDFSSVPKQFGIRVVTPKEFLIDIGELR